MNTETSKTPRLLAILSDPGAIWLLLVSALFAPSVLLFYYSRNSIYVSLAPVLIIAFVCMVITLIVWMGSLFALKNPLAGTIFCLFMWVGVFLESLGHHVILMIFNHVVLYYSLWFLLSAVLVYRLRKINYRHSATFILCAFVLVFFAISFVNSAIIVIRSQTSEKIELKQNFYVDPAITDSPNVYWIHCDEMLNFETVEKYFGDSQDEFLAQLNARGFQVDTGATLSARHLTTVAIPALMCPHFYDSYLSAKLEQPDFTRDEAQSDKIQTPLFKSRICNETLLAFSSAEYLTHTVALLDRYFLPTTDSFYFPITADNFYIYFYALRFSPKQPNSLSEFGGKLSAEEAMKRIRDAEAEQFMFYFFRPGALLFSDKYNIFSDHEAVIQSSDKSSGVQTVENTVSEEKISEIFLGGDASIFNAYYVNAIAEIMDGFVEGQPNFTILMNPMFHSPFVYDENGNYISYVPNESGDYYHQHVYSRKVLINTIDMILEKDPDAVIVLQSDHGLHECSDDELDQVFGMTPGYRREDLRDGVMSAIRVPEKYQNGEEAYAVSNPLNMSRYIINNFVGKNYEYLQESS